MQTQLTKAELPVSEAAAQLPPLKPPRPVTVSGSTPRRGRKLRRGRRAADGGVGYGDDLQHAQQVAMSAIEDLEGRLSERPVQLYYTEFGDSSINFVLRFWVDFRKQTDFLGAQSEAIKAIKTAFDSEGVTIPFPIRTLDFDPNGGVPLTKMLRSGEGEA